MRKWRIEDSEELYNITGWGTSYFGINDKGHVVVTPRKDGVEVDLKELVDELQLRDVAAPMLVRFPDILDNRIEKIAKIRDNRKRKQFICKEDYIMENCIFCKIANGEIPSATLYEDEDFRVILDLGPASKGHALILPKAHAANIYELPDETAGKAMILAKHMATRLRDGLHCDGFNIVQNNGEIAGQTVFHFHMHLIPRYEGDQVGLTWKPGELTDEMKEEILAKVKA